MSEEFKEEGVGLEESEQTESLDEQLADDEFADEPTAPEESTLDNVDDLNAAGKESGELAENDIANESTPEELPAPQEKKKKRRKRRKIDEYTLVNDIRYRGPLSYRWLRILAWTFLILSQVGLLLELGGALDARLATKVGFLPTILKMGKEIMMPLFLIATFATILNGSKSFKSMLILYGGAALIFYILFILFHERYIASLVMFVMEVDRATAVELIDAVLLLILQNGYLSFNIFIDLFLCTLLGFFLIYHPKKVFVGKKLIWFRLFAIIPIAYEVISFIIKLLGVFGQITVSSYLYPLLTTKPPMTFVVFVIITFFIKARAQIYKKRGKTREQYQEFLQTKANSWQFSRFLALIMIVAGILDTVIYLVLALSVAGANTSPEAAEAAEEATMFVATGLLKIGIGGSGALVLAAPIMLLFSYTRTHKNTRIEMFIPILAIIVLIFVYLEAMVIATKMVGSLSNLVKMLTK